MFFSSILIKLCFLLGFSYGFKLNQFGAISNNASYEVALLNGRAFIQGLIAANLSQTDHELQIEPEHVYTIIPASTLINLINVTIRIDGRLNIWDGDEQKWPDILSLISFKNTFGLVITGNGVIDGFGYKWWVKVIKTGYDRRPNLIDVETLKDTLIENITLINSPQYHLNLRDALNLTIRNIIVHVDVNLNDSIIDLLPTFPLNTDGIDISGREINIKNFTVQNFDDAVAIKPISTLGSVYSNCTENIVIEDANVKFGVGMSIGSVPPSDGNACIRNVTIRNIEFKDPFKAIYIKPNPGDSGTGLISNIVYENINIYNALWWAIFIGTQQQHQPHSSGTPCSFFYPLPGTECITNPLISMNNIILRNVSIFNGVLSPGIMICNSTNPCTNFLFDNVNVNNRSDFPIKDGYLCENISGYAKNSNLVPNCLQKL